MVDRNSRTPAGRNRNSFQPLFDDDEEDEREGAGEEYGTRSNTSTTNGTGTEGVGGGHAIAAPRSNRSTDGKVYGTAIAVLQQCQDFPIQTRTTIDNCAHRFLRDIAAIVFDPGASEQIGHEAMTTIYNCILQFLDNVRDDIRDMIIKTNTFTVEDGYDGLDSNRNLTVDQVATVLRFFPELLPTVEAYRARARMEKNNPQQRSTVARKGDVLDESEYECQICLRLLVKPCTLRCGHSFCLHCCHALFDATRNTKKKCPTCRKKVSSSCATNLAISYTFTELLTTAFPEAYEQRLIEVRQEQHEEQQARMEPNNDNHEAENPFAAAAVAVVAAAAAFAAAIDNGDDAFGTTTGGAAARSTRTSHRGPDSTTPGTHNIASGGGDGGDRRMTIASQSNRSTQRQRNTTPQRPTAGVTVTPNPTRTSHRGPDSTTPGTHNIASGGGDGGDRRMTIASQSNRSTQRQRNTTPQRPTAGVTVTPNPTRTSHRGPDSTTPGTNNNASGGGDGGDRRMTIASQSNRSTQRQRNTTPQRPTAGVTPNPTPVTVSNSFEALFDDDED